MTETLNKNDKIKYRSLKQLVELLQKPSLPLQKKEKQIVIDADEVRSKMKQSWKGADAGGRQFAKPEILKSKVLNSWQIQRIALSKRSYTSPKEWKGLKFDASSKQFTIKNEKKMHSKQFLTYLGKVQKEYQSKLTRHDGFQTKNKMNLSKFATTSMKFLKSTPFNTS